MQFDPLERTDYKKFQISKSKMAAAAILKKIENRHISAAVQLILTKFGNSNLLTVLTFENFKF